MGNSPASNLAAFQALAACLKSEPACLQQLVEALPIGVGVHTATGELSLLNEFAKSLLQIKMTSFQPISVADLASCFGFYQLISHELYPTKCLPVFRALQGQPSVVDDIVVRRGDRQLILQSQATPIFDAAGNITHVIATYQDITATLGQATLGHYAASSAHRSEEPDSQRPPDRTVTQPAGLLTPWLEQVLHQSHERLQHWAEAVPGAIYSLRVESDRSIACDYANSQIAAIFEAAQLEVIQYPERYFWDAMHPGDRWSFLRHARQCAVAQTTFIYEWRHVAPSGDIRWLKTVARPELLNDGAICWHGVLLEISEQKQADLNLHHQVVQSTAVLAAIPDLIVRVDRYGYYLSRVRSNVLIDIMPSDIDIEGQHLSDLLPPVAAEQQLNIIQLALETGQVQICEQVLTVDGRQQYEEVRAVPCGADEVLLIVRDVSDRLAAKRSLQEREAHYRRIISALPDLMFRVSRDGYWLGYVHTNAVIDCLPDGYDPTGHHISDHMPSEVAQQQLQKIEQAIATGEMQVFEQSLVLEERTQHEEVRILPQGTDEVLFIVRDITDRKTAELALQKSEAENNAILSAIPDLMFRLHRDGTYLGYIKNENTVDLLAAIGDVAGRNIYDFAQDAFYRQHIEKQMQAVRRVLDTGEMAVYEQKIPVDGGWQHEEVRIVPAGENEVLLIIQNINDRKQAELALQQSQAQKQAILTAIPDLMFHMRQDGTILDYMGGSNFADLLEDGESHVGQNLWDFAKIDTLSAHIQQKMAATQRALQSGQMQIYEQETHFDDTVQQEEVRVVPVTEGEVLVMIRDISDQKRIEAELRTANDRLAKLSLTDALTMLANRRRLDEYLEREWQQSLREQQPISFILFDLDFFKRFNDTYGHQQGDKCLFEVAQAASSVVHRSSDLVARYGGEEFAVVLSNTPLKGAYTIAQHICQAIRALQIAHRTSEVEQVVTASIGVSAIVPALGQKPNVLIRQADQALYAAKQAGRNNCQCFISR